MSVKHYFATSGNHRGTYRQRAASPGGATVISPKNRTFSAISKAVTPKEFKLAYRQAGNGDPAKLFDILDFFKSLDDEIPAALQSLKSAILGSGIQITPKEGEGAQAQQQADVLSAIFDDLDWEALCEELLDAHYFGFSKPVNFTKENWQTESINGRTLQVPVSYEALSRSWIYAKKESRSDDHNTLFVGDAPLYTYPDGSLVLQIAGKLPTRDDINFTRYGTGLGCIRYAIFKYYSYEDWAAMLETFATPMVLGKVGPGGREDVVKKAVIEMANAARAVIGESDSIEFPQANSTMSSDSYDKMVENVNRAISNKIKSESLTDTGLHGGGSYAAARTTNGIRVDVAQYLAGRLTRTIRRKIAQPIADLNWGGKLLVDIFFTVQAADDELQTARAVNEKLKAVPGSEKHIRGILNWPAPEDDEDTVAKSRGIGFGGI